jgi:ribonuclease-3
MKKMESLKDSFKDKKLLDTALTHRSWVNEHKGERASNERLEFLGDAILEYVASNVIYKQFPDKEEGYLTVLRANLVNTTALAKVAKELDLGEVLYLSKGEIEGGGKTNSSLLADTVEAIIGAIFIDRGLPEAEEFIKRYLLNGINEMASGELKDSKSKLQEIIQSKGLPAPKYHVKEESGPDHAKKFVIEVLINGESWGSGQGKSKGEAEQEAARQVLAKRVK